MKRYYNSNTGEWYYEGTSITKNISNGVFSGIPSVEQLESWGFELYVEPAPTHEELLERSRQEKLSALEAFDSSEEVNGFDVSINGEDMTLWIDRETRGDYKASIEAAELLGRTTVKPVFNGREVELSVEMAKMALAQVQLYANQCYGVTQRHKADILGLSTVEDIEGYEFDGYPERLRFEV
jgi:hypothetical protein